VQTRIRGNIGQIRAVEDCIRATKKYTEGAFTARKQHPVQGQDFPSRVLTKIYEVYPETEISWNMPVNTAMDWLWCDTPCVMVTFFYDYRSNNAHVDIEGDDAVKQLDRNIPGFITARTATEKHEGGTESTREAERPHFPTHLHVRRPAKTV